jgi:hypothetical protein
MPFRVPDGGVEAGFLGFRSKILIPPGGFHGAFLAFFGWLGAMGAFLLLARVCEAPVPDPVEAPWEDLIPGSRAETGMAGIGMSPSNPGMGEMKLSKSCIQKLEYELLKK